MIRAVNYLIWIVRADKTCHIDPTPAKRANGAWLSRFS